VIFTPEERRALLALLALLIFGQAVSLWEEHRRAHPDRELGEWLTRLALARGDSAASIPADSLLAAFEPADSAGADSLAPVPLRSRAEIPPGILETGRVRINDAGLTDLDGLPGIGPALARRILDCRSKSGPFRRPEDLLKVSGIGPKKLAALRERIDLAAPAESAGALVPVDSAWTRPGSNWTTGGLRPGRSADATRGDGGTRRGCRDTVGPRQGALRTDPP
jgi:competence ComEA-like helix-hairpin-helix protein